MSKTIHPPRLLSLVVLGMALSPLLAASPDDVKASVGQTVEITRSHGWCWFPTIHKFRSGEILVSMSMCPDEVNAESQHSAYCISKDGGITWGPRFPVGGEAMQGGAWSEEPDHDDAIWMWCCYPEWVREGDGSRYYAELAKYSHGGRRLSIDRDVTVRLAHPAIAYPNWLFGYKFKHVWPIPDPVADTRFKTAVATRPFGNIIAGPNHDLLCTSYITTAEGKRREEADPRKRRFNRVILLRSTDGGNNWTEYGTIAALGEGERPGWVGNEGYNEGSISLLPDGRLYAVYRTGGNDGEIGNGWSSDGGKTWTAPASIGFMGVAPRIHRLGNGMLALVTGRPGPVVLRFNPDGLGRNWTHGVTLFREMCTRYCDLAEIAPGKLLVVYDSVPYAWNEIPYADRDGRNRILGTFVTIEP